MLQSQLQFNYFTVFALEYLQLYKYVFTILPKLNEKQSKETDLSLIVLAFENLTFLAETNLSSPAKIS